MARIYQVLEICYPNGTGMDRYRMTVHSDEESWPPYGICKHEHRTREAARECREVKRRFRKIFGYRRAKKKSAAVHSSS